MYFSLADQLFGISTKTSILVSGRENLWNSMPFLEEMVGLLKKKKEYIKYNWLFQQELGVTGSKSYSVSF